MKTNRSARYIIRLRFIVLLLAIASAIGVEFRLCESLGQRIGHTTGVQTEAPPVSNVYFPN
jgi:hypothetical protein